MLYAVSDVGLKVLGVVLGALASGAVLRFGPRLAPLARAAAAAAAFAAGMEVVSAGASASVLAQPWLLSGEAHRAFMLLVLLQGGRAAVAVAGAGYLATSRFLLAGGAAGVMAVLTWRWFVAYASCYVTIWGAYHVDRRVLFEMATGIFTSAALAGGAFVGGGPRR